MNFLKEGWINLMWRGYGSNIIQGVGGGGVWGHRGREGVQYDFFDIIRN